YDITGLFGSTCARHGVPERFVDMNTIGERFCYPMAIISAVKDKYGGNFSMMYDIACKLPKQIQAKFGDQVNIKLALGIFHSYAHSIDCQAKFSPRYLTGFGLTDGEWMERLWSYLGGFVKVTRAMSKSYRRLTLASALRHFKQDKMMHMGKACRIWHCLFFIFID
ncbi:hypothetical protein BC941DRAFT_364378, partial [Chlamydoabsidia padenii]